ncbi:hypothetical protein L0337_34185 [candidate division KSB1 bacterium]|nr:hypothetical protein [candidate division KSB1 bacterium]
MPRRINFQPITKPALSAPILEWKASEREALPIAVIKLRPRPFILIGSFGEKSKEWRIDDLAVRLRMRLPNQ